MAVRKRGRDASGHVDPFYQRRRRYEAVLRGLRLWETFAAMPRRAHDQFLKQKFPDPVLEFDPSFPDDADHRALRKTLESNFREASLMIEDVDMTVRDFFAVLVSVKCVVHDSRNEPGLPESCMKFMRQAGPLLDYWFEEHLPDVWPALHGAVIVPLVARSRLDGRLLTATVEQEFLPHGKFVIRMTVRATEPQVRRVSLDGAVRPMYRVATCNEWEGVRWLNWDAARLGRGESTEQLPVYVQSHALRQLYSRVNLSRMTPYLACWLHESLKKPLIVERDGDDMLVEYRIREDRIGYLVVTALKNLVAVRTFKFLTMERTPERRMLEKRLRLTRRDVDWLGLHELSAFTQTDLRDDPVLRPLMEECGCGHLFKWGGAEGEGGAGEFAPEPKAFAAEVRRYLRMAA